MCSLQGFPFKTPTWEQSARGLSWTLAVTFIRMKYVLCTVQKGNTNSMMEKKMTIWNFAPSRFFKLSKSNITQTFIKHVLPTFEHGGNQPPKKYKP